MKPHVVTAPRHVTEAAAELGLVRCVERAVEDALPTAIKLGGGRLRIRVDADGRRNGRDRPTAYLIDVKRTRSPFGRRAWMPVSVRRSEIRGPEMTAAHEREENRP